MRDAHLSGRFDATPAEWLAVGELVAGMDVFSLTEARGVPLPGPVRRAGDAVVGWNRARFGELGYVRTMLTERSWRAGKHERRGVPCVWVALLDRDTGRTLLRAAAHLPASVQAGDGFSRKPADRDNVAAWRDALDGLGRQTRQLRRALEPEEATIAADWNVDLARGVWCERIEAALPTGLRLAVPTGPTHHRRTIDAHATTLDTRGARTARRRFAGFDHRLITLRAAAERRAATRA